MAKNETSKSVATKAAKILADPDASEDVKSVAASALKQAPSKKPKKVEIEPEVYVPQLGVIAQFEGKDEFLGEIVSFDPLEVVEHSLIRGCPATEPREMDSLEGYVISPLSRVEVVKRLY